MSTAPGLETTRVGRHLLGVAENPRNLVTQLKAQRQRHLPNGKLAGQDVTEATGAEGVHRNVFFEGDGEHVAGFGSVTSPEPPTL